MLNLQKIFLTLLLGPLLCMSFTNSLLAQVIKNDRSITISSVGQVTAVPDIAKVQTGVISEGTSAYLVLSKNNDSLKKLIEGLKSNIIEDKDIRTTSFQIEPRYTAPREGKAAVIDGYRIVNLVEVTIKNLKSVGELLDQLVALGANQMGGLTFEISSAEKLKDEARKEAVKNARLRAELYADATNSKLGKVLVISEGEVSTPQPFLRAARAVAADAVPLEKGSISVEALVTITWELE